MVYAVATPGRSAPGLAAEHLVAEEAADIVSLGKGALSNMDWPDRVREERPLNDFDPEVLGYLGRL